MLSPLWGADALWWSFPVGSAASALLLYAYYRFGGWKQAKMIEHERRHGGMPAFAAE
jgi:Na+-driven multidrug efflux pump